jgi:alanyl-tRNA synthetase/REP element-mobilizing transposase RayT
MSSPYIRSSSQVRKDFLDFFKSKQHTIVPSSSLMPDSPNLLFTNAGMNQFVPIFLGQTRCPYTPGRAADTQKCIRAGGKHNDLDDVGLDTYHHTFFEMLGNWSFGDYFKPEAIAWAWELVVEIWKFPPQRLYATVYNPDKTKNDPSEFDQEAWNFWAGKFRSVGLDPAIHIVNGNKKDNFWMMGETGPCGPCSELHVDLTPAGDTKGALVNKGDARCIEIWNLVFIQFNANPDGTFSSLPAKHVDTGMGFERVTSILQGTKGLTDFANARISNYETDIFRPIFDALEKLSGRTYGSTLPMAAPAPGTMAAIADAEAPIKTSGEGPSSIVEVPVAPRSEEPTCAEITGAPSAEQIQVHIAFRVIADHIRTLSFAIADGIEPGNSDRNYVLRRILRRAVRYGRTLGFKEPFFYKLVDVLAETMGDVFPEIRARKKHVQDVIRLEEEGFNKTLDRGIALFEDEAARLLGSARGPRAEAGGPPASRSTNLFSAEGKPGSIQPGPGANYSKRRLPHFEMPWAIYHITLTTLERRRLEASDRDIVFDCIRHWNGRRYRLIAACVMPDHAHLIIQPGIESQDTDGNPIFYSLTTILHTIKSFTAHEINKRSGLAGGVWEKEKFDRYIRSDADLEEKFHYICRNPWDAGLVQANEPWPWVWTPEYEAWDLNQSGERSVRRAAEQSTPAACVPQISAAFAFRLYDEQGFPLDLTQLMARERGLTVDTVGFEKLMEEQRARARAAQKKEVISLSQIETTAPTKFVGYETLTAAAKVLEVVSFKDKTAVVLDASACYAEMGGQVGDTGELSSSGGGWQITNTQKSGNTWLHFVEGNEVPLVGAGATVSVAAARRHAIERHHTVTHLLHWALHEVANPHASQKGSFVGPNKLTFDFNSAPLTPQQVADIEKLVNERIVENAPVSWTEVPHAEVKNRTDVMQFFGDKYGDVVRVVQIGGQPQRLDGYSMELCGGTHTRATGEIGLFRIVGEAAIAAGVRRIEAVAGMEAYTLANGELQLIRSLAGKLNAPVHELEKKVEALLTHQKELEKSLKAAVQKEAAAAAVGLMAGAQDVSGIPLLTRNLGEADADYLQAIVDALKGRFKGVVVVGGAVGGAVTLIAAVSPEFTNRVQAGKIIQTIAPIVGGKGGGKPDNARGGGRDASKVEEALAKVRSLVG